MEYKWQTLQVIYDLVKNDNKPSMSNITTNKIILCQHYPWDEIVLYLNELTNEGHIIMKQLNTAVASITDKGFQFASSNNIVTA